MTRSTVAYLQYPGNARSDLRMLAKGSYTFLEAVAAPESISGKVLSAKDMVARLRDGGLPVASLADILKVERKTVYSWLDGVDPRGANVSRIEVLYGLLANDQIDLRTLYRVFNRRLDHGHSLRDLLSADPISALAVRDALQILAPSLERHSERDKRQEAPQHGWNIPLIDEMPTAGSRD